MLFLFPKKKIVLDCFTSHPYVMEYSPIHFAIKHIPDWWKDLPKSYEDEMSRNMRNCPGMIEYYKKSIAIPLWCDLRIKIHEDKNYEWQFVDLQSEASVHARSQMLGFLQNHGHLKLLSPWRFISEKGVNWVWSHPTYNYSFSNDITCLPGITEFYYQHTCHINMMLPLQQPKKIVIKQGQTLALLTPMSDRKVHIVRHLVDEKEINRLRNKNTAISFSGTYKNSIKRKNQFNDCPYHKDK